MARLRPMRWWDIEPVLRLERTLFVDDAWTEGVFWSELAERATRHYLVADADEAGDDPDEEADVLGYAGLCVYGRDEAFVQTIAVAPAAQRHGLGTRLLTALIDESVARGCRQLDLEVRADNATAINLYARHGFTQIGRRRGYYQPSGADAIVMRRKSS
ncbi:MAG: ribosomal protein S18-alanine N-acetyltransferase [Frankiales bacterium]|nr:ribosomal protein S18-alanine N-acetyltransferase [Frankiales bacterium]